MHFAGVARIFARNFVDAALLFDAQHRTFTDARAGDETGDCRERSKVFCQSLQTFDIESARVFEGRDIRDEETGETFVNRWHKILPGSPLRVVLGSSA